MDLQILYALQNIHTDWLNPIMVFITHLGDTGQIWIVTAVILLFFKKTRKCGVFMLLALLTGFLLGDKTLKLIVQRSRPCWNFSNYQNLIPVPYDYSFPSGHTLSSFSSATTIFLHFKKPGIAALTLAALIAFSRLYLFVHYPTDVLVGMIMGITIACVLFFLWKYIAARRTEKSV